MIKVPLYVKCLGDMGDDLAIPMDFAGGVDMHIGPVWSEGWI